MQIYWSVTTPLWTNCEAAFVYSQPSKDRSNRNTDANAEQQPNGAKDIRCSIRLTREQKSPSHASLMHGSLGNTNFRGPCAVGTAVQALVQQKIRNWQVGLEKAPSTQWRQCSIIQSSEDDRHTAASNLVVYCCKPLDVWMHVLDVAA